MTKFSGFLKLKSNCLFNLDSTLEDEEYSYVEDTALPKNRKLLNGKLLVIYDHSREMYSNCFVDKKIEEFYIYILLHLNI